jgi:hypothetical protein
MGGERKLNSPVAIEGRGRRESAQASHTRRFRSLLDADEVENDN